MCVKKIICLSPVFQCYDGKISFVTQHCLNKNMSKKKKMIMSNFTMELWCIVMTSDLGFVWNFRIWHELLIAMPVQLFSLFYFSSSLKLVGILSQVNHKGLHHGKKQCSICLLFTLHTSHQTTNSPPNHKISPDTNLHI